MHVSLVNLKFRKKLRYYLLKTTWACAWPGMNTGMHVQLGVHMQFGVHVAGNSGNQAFPEIHRHFWKCLGN